MITEKQLCKALSQYNGEEVDSLQQVVKITFSGEELLEFVNSLPSEEEKKGDWYRCLSPYKDFVKGRYYQLELHGEPSPQIQVAFDLRHGYEINPNAILEQ